MTAQKSFFRIFFASPGDVAPEREIISDVVNEINRVLGDSHNVYLELVKWETHARPDFGRDPQDVINQQIGDGYEIFIGLMWGRFGAPTGRAESGTEEEFYRALDRHKQSPSSVTIMLYFKNAPIAPSDIDPIQIGKVQKFKTHVSKELGGLYYQFDSTEGFASKVRVDLMRLVLEMLNRPPAPKNSIQTTASDFRVALSHFNALEEDDDYEEGIVELTEKSQAALRKVSEILERITAANQRLTEKVDPATEEVRQAVQTGGAAIIEARKRIPNRIAEDLERFVSELLLAIPEFHRQHSLAMELFGKLAIISNAELAEPTENFVAVLESLRTLRGTTQMSAAQVGGLRDSIAGSPRMTTAYNRAKKRAAALLDDLVSQMETAISSTENVEALIETIIKNRGGS
jgi:hypothetical protein